ncbi:hypothetical protein ABT218_07305 [Streptomyces sp. NPDC001455]|uniref:hypothetical protein n=1 Tax=Streptomyces sp. NPDC001455 TaxID=3154518 RepID=UPI00332640F1
MPVNNDEFAGNTARRSSAVAGVALPPVFIVPGSPGYTALALMLGPVALWALVVWLSSRGGPMSG